MSVIEFLRSCRKLRLLSIPTKSGFRIANYLDGTGARFYYDFIARHDRIDGLRYMEEDHVVYQLVRPDLGYFGKKYNINTVVAKKETVKSAHKRGIHYAFATEGIVFENEYYLVFRPV